MVIRSCDFLKAQYIILPFSLSYWVYWDYNHYNFFFLDFPHITHVALFQSPIR